MEALFQFASGKWQIAGRTSQCKHFPTKGPGPACQFYGGGLQTTGAIKGDGFLGEVFQGCVFGYLQPGMLAPGNAMAISLVQFGSRWGGQQRVPTFGNSGFNAQFVPAYQAARRMQQIHMAATGFTFRVERALNSQRSQMTPVHQPGDWG